MNYIDPHSKLLQHPDRIAALKMGGTPPPVNVEIDLSNRCSLGCSWCHFGYTHTRGPLAGKRSKPAGNIDGGDLMDTEFAYQMMSELADYGVLSITWAGGGEPTLHPDFDSIIERCPIDQGIYTHGGHISRERAEIMKSKMVWCYVSLDCVDAESYQREKGVDYFERAVAGIRNLASANGKATIGVGFLLHPGNHHQVFRMAELGKELGSDYVQFRPAVMYSQAEPGKPAEDTEWIYRCIQALEYAAGIPGVIVDLDRFKMYRDWKRHGYETCWWSMLSTVITPNGKVWTCVNKREHSGAMLGDMNSESFSDIWRRKKAAHVNGHCRVLCRGHIANMTLDSIMRDVPHSNFI